MKQKRIILLLKIKTQRNPERGMLPKSLLTDIMRNQEQLHDIKIN